MLGEGATVERALRIAPRGSGGRRRCATMAQDLRDVPDALGPFREAQRHVPLLCALELGAEPADLGQPAPADGSHPPEVVVREEQLR